MYILCLISLSVVPWEKLLKKISFGLITFVLRNVHIMLNWCTESLAFSFGFSKQTWMSWALILYHTSRFQISYINLFVDIKYYWHFSKQFFQKSNFLVLCIFLNKWLLCDVNFAWAKSKDSFLFILNNL